MSADGFTSNNPELVAALQRRVSYLADRVSELEERLDELEASGGARSGGRDARIEAVASSLINRAAEGDLPVGEYGPQVTRPTFVDTIKNVAGVNSRQTVKAYMEEVATRPEFRHHPDAAATWVVEP